MNRDIHLNASLDPDISGYGGFDSWVLEGLTEDRRNQFFKSLDRLVGTFGGYWDGVQ